MSGDAEPELVMPFVTTQSHGGPHDDGSFVAGWECAAIDRWLGGVKDAGGVRVNRYVHNDTLPQLDLIAMQHGFTMTTEVDQGTEWSADWTWAAFNNDPKPPAQERTDG